MKNILKPNLIMHLLNIIYLIICNINIWTLLIGYQSLSHFSPKVNMHYSTVIIVYKNFFKNLYHGIYPYLMQQYGILQ